MPIIWTGNASCVRSSTCSGNAAMLGNVSGTCADGGKPHTAAYAATSLGSMRTPRCLTMIRGNVSPRRIERLRESSALPNSFKSDGGLETSMTRASDIEAVYCVSHEASS